MSEGSSALERPGNEPPPYAEATGGRSAARPFAEYEKKWQESWEQSGIYRAKDPNGKKEDKYYGLIEFPYPSGAGLHTGHPRSYTAIDIVTRKRRMEGKNVLYPIGWDAFGLPTENYAIKNKIKPQDATKANEAVFERQLRMLGLGFDWSRVIDTTDSAYYKWTQWMFLKFFKSAFDEKDGRAKSIEGQDDAALRMAYKDKTTINWCPSCKIGLANEEAIGGVCERCGTAVEKRIKEQWMIRITKYAERLLKDLDTVDYLEKIKTQQVNWIGRSEGANIGFAVKRASGPAVSDKVIRVFTTRPDTLFGVTYVVLAPEHEFVSKWIADGIIANADEVKAYCEEAARKTEIERSAEEKEKTGVKLDGVVAVNPANGEEVPVFIADYVLVNYGTGAVMAVPAHDERDYVFAKKYELPIKEVVREAKPKTCLIVHGIEGHSKENWFPWLREHLEQSGWNVIVPDLPNAKHPTPEEWRSALMAYADQLDERSVIIGHSLGGTAAIDLVQTMNKKIGSLVLVAPTGAFEDWPSMGKTVPDIDWEAVDRFCKAVTVDGDQIKSLTTNRLVIFSDNDPYIPMSVIDAYRTLIPSAEFKCIPGKFHFSECQGICILPELRDELIGCFTDDGISINSDFMNGLATPEAKQKIVSWLEEKKSGERAITYKLRDWVFSRQRYWGEPIPIIICPKCGYVPVPEDQLPVLLPDIESYETTDTGESPLAKIRDWVETTCPQCGGKAERETDTMPNWAGSSWYFLRYCDPKNDAAFADAEKLKYWMPVDLYNGGMEHTTLHLLYSRFWHKVLWDLGFIPKECGSEPYARRRSHGLVLAEGGEKMSKSKGNVVNPDEVVEKYGADVFRVYEMFMGPFDQPVPWDTNGIEGVRRFLDKVWRLFEGSGDKGQGSGSADLETIYHQSVKKITEDIESLGFNTAVSQLMILTNAFVDAGGVPEEMVDGYLKILAPFAPHLAEELWHRKHHQSFIGKLFGRETTIHLESWPAFDPAKAVAATFELVIQVNGKVRDRIEVPAGISEEDARAKALASENVKKYLEGKEPKKIIYVKGKLVTIAV